MIKNKRQEWSDKIQAGVRAGISDALEEHRRSGRKVPVGSKGRVVWLTVEKALAKAGKPGVRAT